MALGVEGHGNDAEIDIGGQAPIQPDLGLTGLIPLFFGAEVEKPERHGLLHLVGVFAPEEHPGDVSLPELDAGSEKVARQRAHDFLG
jgi:hypothetical protein